MKNLDELDQLRNKIDDVTRQLVTLINKRAEIAVYIGKVKKGQPIYDPAREATVLAEVAARNTGPLSDHDLQIIFKTIIAACRTIQQPLSVAYLGPEGTYCEEAAFKQYGEGCDFISCATIDATIHAVEAGNADVAVVPVENSTEGSVNYTLDLLAGSPLIIMGETVLSIHHQLLSHAASLNGITEVTAHPQALAQCRAWLDANLPGVAQTSAKSNGAAAQAAASNKHLEAIASKRAADYYGVPIVAKNIEDEPNNTTRFLCLGTRRSTPTGTDKTSLICSVPNQPGALHELLDVFAAEGVNMIKLESRPAPHALWHYVFYIDIEGHQEDAAIKRALSQLQTRSGLVKILGSYPKGISL